MTGSRGFSLLEVLVALVVLSVALLGLAGLQLKSLQGAHVAYQRSLGTLAARDAGERLWEWQANQRIAGAPFACPDGTVLASLEGDWRQDWEPVLPGFEQSVLQEMSGSCRFAVTARWHDDRFTSAEGESVSRLEYRVSLPND